MSKIVTREHWLQVAVGHIRPIFQERGFSIPKVRVSCGFPSTSRRGSAVGQCWGSSFSADGVNEIFVTPIFDKPLDVLDTLVHELVHAIDDCKHKHGKEFKKIALSVGLEGKMINATAGPKLKKRLEYIARKIEKLNGKYPHGAMSFPIANTSKQTRINPKAECPICGFTVTLSMRFLKVGPPICPKDSVLMEKKGKWPSNEVTAS
ncbi:MAG: hypothetical protein CBC42_01355 [Betaproteobacteria bacterium TMED82]|nr:MAG: hypothetical protein CBC42_01355 [Betaproteobacteria bacterium TMED82]|tara:strand:+ start:19043 stop:19660 length:618 start_codon:yes stop_codon:yes gene_type:complete